MARRRRTRLVTVDVDMDDFDDDDLVEALKDRGYAVIKGAGEVATNDLEMIYTAIRQRRWSDAMSGLERILWPKWKAPADCQKAYEQLFGKPS